MQYIVLDIEWNQAWPGSTSAQKAPSLRGEIIQLGAVKLNADMTPGEEYQQLVYPKFFSRISKRVAQLTGIHDSDVREHGLPFPMVVKSFRKFCGDDFALLTWGCDDIPMLRENLDVHGLETDWIHNWYNLQLIFNAQTDGSHGQKALKTAMDMYGIEATRPAHDALGDAYHTALICGKLDLKKGIRDYAKSKTKAEESAEDIPGCVQRKVFHGFNSKDDALKAMEGAENICPSCKRRMETGRWISQQGHRYMVMMTCPKHGEFLVRARLVTEENNTLRVIRLVYSSDSEPAAGYRARLEKAQPHQAEKKQKRGFRFSLFRKRGKAKQ